MGNYRIQCEHIPDDGLIPDELLHNSSQRYFQTWGRAVHTGQHPCNHRWTSRRAYCVLDLKNQCIAYTAPKDCFTWEIPAKTIYDMDSLSRMAKYASRSYLHLSDKQQVTLLRELDDMIVLILNGTLKSATFAHWIHQTNHTMYGHDYWRSRL